MAKELSSLTDSIKTGNRAAAKALVQQQLDGGAAPKLLLGAMVAGMDDVGHRFRNNEIFVPEVLIAARAMKEAMTLLEPKLAASGHQPIATAIIGTVQGDLHDIGKNLVAMMWRGASFAVHDLGTNVSPLRFIDEARRNNARIIGLSALLTTTLPAMRETVRTIRQAALPGVMVMVGGAPVTESLANEMGADGFAADAVSAVDRARQLLKISA